MTSCIVIHMIEVLFVTGFVVMLFLAFMSIMMVLAYGLTIVLDAIYYWLKKLCGGRK